WLDRALTRLVVERAGGAVPVAGVGPHALPRGFLRRREDEEAVRRTLLADRDWRHQAMAIPRAHALQRRQQVGALWNLAGLRHLRHGVGEQAAGEPPVHREEVD